MPTAGVRRAASTGAPQATPTAGAVTVVETPEDASTDVCDVRWATATPTASCRRGFRRRC